MAHAACRSHALLQSLARPAALARLMKTEDWADLTRKANASPNNPNGLERWRRIIREKNPNLREDRVERLAEMMRSEHYRRVANSRWHPEDVAESVCLRCGKAGHQSAACAEDDGERAA